MRRARVRQPGEPERACGQQLVVGDDERAGRVPDVHAAGRKPLELAGAAFDAVELLANVEPRESYVSGLEKPKRPARLDELGVVTQRARCGAERLVRRAAPIGAD